MKVFYLIILAVFTTIPSIFCQEKKIEVNNDGLTELVRFASFTSFVSTGIIGAYNFVHLSKKKGNKKLINLGFTFSVVNTGLSFLFRNYENNRNYFWIRNSVSLLTVTTGTLRIFHNKKYAVPAVVGFNLMEENSKLALGLSLRAQF